MLTVDWATATSVIFVALVAVIDAAAAPAWLYILVAHGILVVFILVLPPRGARGNGRSLKIRPCSPG